MVRVPGTPEEKLALLARIDQRTLPHLAGDILYFLYNHRDIRVVDGPGDGKRDVHSRKPDGLYHITQCKYHQNTNATVSSNETDELVLALMKFGCKAGLFVTTGRISPQAKREYLDNYPGLELDFLDGVNLVDTVLSSPVLSAVWFDGKSIVQTRQALQMPFILRRIMDDMPAKIDTLPNTTSEGISYNFRNEVIEKERLEPYRKPSDRYNSEHGSKFAHGHIAYYIGNAGLHDTPKLRQFIATLVASDISDAQIPVTIRFGSPSLVTNREAMTEQFMRDDDDSIVIPQIKPISFVIDRDRGIKEEREWVVLTSNEQWKFPDNLSVAEAEWAGWLNRSHNTICIQELDSPTEDPPYQEFIFRSLRQEWLSKSLFTVVSKTDYPSLLESLREAEHPTWLSDYGPGGLLVGWLHPLYLYERYGRNIAIRYNQEQGRYEGFVHDDLEETEFIKLLDKLKENLSCQNLPYLPSETAILVAAASGDPLLPEISFIEIGSAQLFHDFEDVSSPVYLNKRRLIFVRMWKIPASPQEAIEILSAHPIDLGDEAQTYWDTKRGPRTKETEVYPKSWTVLSCDICDPQGRN